MLEFTKMQGLGNDFVLINCIKNKFQYSIPILAKFLCDRQFGIGADGIILIYASKVADFKMRIFNSDGTEAQMCGNGIRCLGKYVYEKKLTAKKQMTVETLAGVKTLFLNIEGNTVTSVKVDMGQAIFQARKIPIILQNYDSKKVWHTIQIEFENMMYNFDCVSIGNPHAVVIVDDLEKIDVKKIGKYVENYKNFPLKTNVEFVKIIDKKTIKIKVWERGVGQTMACGSGACASAIVAFVNNLIEPRVTVQLDGGTLEIEIENTIWMVGGAESVYDGIMNL